MPADLPHPSESAQIRREGEALERAWSPTSDPPQVPHDDSQFDHSAAVERVLESSSQDRPTR